MLAALIGLALLVLAGLGWRGGRAAAQARGAALYHGQVALPGRLVGHDMTLPQIATRCSNCHDAGAAGPAPAGRARFATPLAAASLAEVRGRRGGPPSVYDARALCTLLRNGVDPAQVMIDNAMPRYQPTDDQCEDLWSFLLSR